MLKLIAAASNNGGGLLQNLLPRAAMASNRLMATKGTPEEMIEDAKLPIHEQRWPPFSDMVGHYYERVSK